MKVTFLGTGTSQGVPVIGCGCEVCSSLDFRDKRLRSSIYAEVDDQHLVFDTGPDFRQQILRERIKRVDGVVFTHEHKDHTAGLDDIRAFNYLQKMDIPVYAKHRVLEHLKKEFSYIFSERKYPGIPKILLNEITNHPFFIKETRITPVEVMHYQLPVFGYRVKDFTYITDANFISREEIEKVKGSKVLVLNALQKSPHISHFTLSQATELAREINAEKTFFTHISHNLGTHKNVSLDLPEKVFLAYDGLKVEL